MKTHRPAFPEPAEPLHHYRISDHGLLSRDEEIALGRRVQAGFREESAWRGREKVLRYHFTADAKAAITELVEHNQRLVVKLARMYRGRGMPLADLIACGHEGLLRAVVKFDPERGNRFSTYASFWIRQRIRRQMRQNFLISIPEYLPDDKRPTFGIMQICDRCERPRIQAKAETQIEQQDEYTNLLKTMRAVCGARDSAIVLARMRGYTLAEIAEWHGVTRERIRQIQVDVLTRMRRIMHARYK